MSDMDELQELIDKALQMENIVPSQVIPNFLFLANKCRSFGKKLRLALQELQELKKDD